MPRAKKAASPTTDAGTDEHTVDENGASKGDNFGVEVCALKWMTSEEYF